MGHTERRRRIEAPPDLVWDVMTDPDVYARVAPNLASVEIVSGDGEGMVRRCVDADGNVWTESCTRWADGHEFAVAVDVADSDFHRRLFTRFEGRWALSTDGDGGVVTVAFEYDPRYGPLGTLVSKYVAYRAPPLIEAIFDGWEAEVEARLVTQRSRQGREVESG
jgi:carbon monoxide dehydrogenase subunit G